jgi:hypothetical protein
LILIGVSRPPFRKNFLLKAFNSSIMSSQDAPRSPLVTYPPDAAAPGYNYRDYYPDSPDPVFVPVPGDEDFVEPSTNFDREDRVEMSSAA